VPLEQGEHLVAHPRRVPELDCGRYPPRERAEEEVDARIVALHSRQQLDQ
jgi:hypothetical protein